ncbi:YafY family transcriptional regulator [Paenibacillus albidus]|uniref:helix-turn-helix transcriptional regulator n=1 Tax=Paenibacillus albidus TaxID=2041023 RepID=UPI001BECD13F|nr:YafY family protein [Paenibacillus albidus]MBT2288975.1 YafY family transcriptional regulator [Paenibacillus albidus]
MPKSKRLLELMMTVNRKRKFTVKELAGEFGVSTRTILRDLQELGELGVPLYSEVGPHGGYQVLNERILPPIAFTEEEAVAIFFASHALRHYTDLPFKEASSSALHKFYHYMPGDVRDRIDEMKNRVDFVTPTRQAESPHLSMLLEAAVQQKVLLIEYAKADAEEQRPAGRLIQPIGVYAHGGLWYCPAYCFQRGGLRIFRCDRMLSAAYDTSGLEPQDLRHIHLGNRELFMPGLGQEQRRMEEGVRDAELPERREQLTLLVQLGKAGVQRCEAEQWTTSQLHIREDGSGWLAGCVAKSELPFLARFVIGLGSEATVQEPPELVQEMKRALAEIMAKYDN